MKMCEKGFCFALSGLFLYRYDPNPRALPRAVMLGPFGVFIIGGPQAHPDMERPLSNSIFVFLFHFSFFDA